MKLTTLKIYTSKLNVTIQTTDHNLLRWVAMAMDVNATFAKSLMDFSRNTPVYLTDSIYLERHNPDISDVPFNTHIILWDGINSYFELMNKQAALVLRPDLKFYVVGRLKGVMVVDNIHIQPLYLDTIPDKAKAWDNVWSFHQGFSVPYWYRLLTTVLTHTRYFKNWLSNPRKHCQLSHGGKMVFCGLVTPTEHNLKSFFIGTNLPQLQKACSTLLTVEYTSSTEEVDRVVYQVIEAIKAEHLTRASEFACVYSILNLLHRIRTLSFLRQLSTALFVNEVRNSSRIDPYDSFFYLNNLYLDFGSTRGPDAIYPRTLDLVMKQKRFVSLRYLPSTQTVYNYVELLSAKDFSQQCEVDAHSAYQIYLQMFN